MPNLAWAGIYNPALAAGVYTGIKPLLEAAASPGAIATMGLAPALGAASETFPMAKVALGGISGLFAGLMAKAGYNSAKAAPKILTDPTKSLQDKVAAVTEPVAETAAGLLGIVGAAIEVLPHSEGPVLVKAMDGKTPQEAAQVLREKAAEVKDPVDQGIMHDAADELEKVHTEKPAEPVQSKETLPTVSATEDLKKMATGEKTSPLKSAMAEGQKMGISPPGAESLRALADDARQTFKGVADFTRNVPKLEGFKKILNEWVGGRQMGAIRMVPFIREMKRIAPDVETRDGIANWLDARGDMDELKSRYQDTTKAGLKRGYKAALNLTPDQIQLAGRIKQWFDEQFDRANSAGVMKDESFRENYVTQLIEKPFVGGGVKSEFYGKLNKNFQFSQQRTFPNFGELEKAGFTAKSKDIAEIAARYDSSLTKAIETRKMTDALEKTKHEQGDPLAIRGQMPDDVESNYETIDHPSLRGLKLHEDIASHLRNVLGRSAIRDWYEQPGSPVLQLGKGAVKFVDEANRTFANTMLSGLSTFHLVHEAKRALGNRVNVFNLDEIKPEDPMVEQAAKSGLIMVSENSPLAEFTEGTGGHKSLTDRVPGLSQINHLVSDITFNKIIPRIKFSTWQAIRARNLELLKPEIDAGKVTKGDVDYLTSQQVNARFGHLNTADLGKNLTIQHIMRFGLLAPDFLEANVRNYGQVLSGLTGSKAGREPLKAFALTAGVLWTTARVANMALNDDRDPHFEEPFSLVAGNRVYTMRNEAADAWKFIKNTRGYVSGRLSPELNTMIGMLQGKNWRGEKQSVPDALRDMAANVVPISMRWIPGISAGLDKLSPTERTKTVSLFDEFLSSQGVQVGRKSDINDAYALANDWKKSVGIKEDTGVYPVSKYIGIRYALEDKDPSRVLEEIKKLNPKTTGDVASIVKGIKQSILHPFTGNKSTDEEFIQSLDAKDKHKVLTAEFMRQAMVGQFMKLADEYVKDNKVPEGEKYNNLQKVEESTRNLPPRNIRTTNRKKPQ